MEEEIANITEREEKETISKEDMARENDPDLNPIHPDVERYHIMIEGAVKEGLDKNSLLFYCRGLSEKLGIPLLSSPTLNCKDKLNLGCHAALRDGGCISILYWGKLSEPLFTAYIITRKALDPVKAMEYTTQLFHEKLLIAVYKDRTVPPTAMIRDYNAANCHG